MFLLVNLYYKCYATLLLAQFQSVPVSRMHMFCLFSTLTCCEVAFPLGTEYQRKQYKAFWEWALLFSVILKLLSEESLGSQKNQTAETEDKECLHLLRKYKDGVINEYTHMC